MLVFNSEAIFEKVMENFPSYSAGVSDTSIDSLIHVAQAAYLQEWSQGNWDEECEGYINGLAQGDLSLESLDFYEECAGIAQQFCGASYGVLLAKYQKKELTDIEYTYAAMMLAGFLFENFGKICPAFLEVPG